MAICVSIADMGLCLVLFVLFYFVLLALRSCFIIIIILLAPVVQTMDSTTCWINHNPVDNVIHLLDNSILWPDVLLPLSRLGFWPSGK